MSHTLRLSHKGLLFLGAGFLPHSRQLQQQGLGLSCAIKYLSQCTCPLRSASSVASMSLGRIVRAKHAYALAGFFGMLGLCFLPLP